METDSTMADASLPAPTTHSNSSPAPTLPSHNAPRQTPDQSAPSNGTNGKLSLPKTAAHHGAPTRDWINTHVTGVLLEGMKLLAAERPEMPLHALGTFLIKRSAEIEGRSGGEGEEG